MLSRFSSIACSTLRLGPNASIEGDLSAYIGIVLEKGTVDLAEHLLSVMAKDSNHQRALLSGVAKIVEAAHQNNIALMDFKPQNIVHCNAHGVGVWKAIDFEHSRYFGDQVANAATAQYASYEMARHVLSGSGASLKADPAMDICSFGWVVWRIFSSVTLWESLGIAADDTAVFNVLASMTQEKLIMHINQAFPSGGVIHAALRNFLPQVLHVNPRCRPVASRLRATTSLFGDREPTYSPQAVMSAMQIGFAKTDGKLDDLANEIRSAWSNLSAQLGENLIVKSLDDHSAGAVAITLAGIVNMLEQQREDARSNRLSIDTIARGMSTLNADLAASVLPAITTIMSDRHNQTDKLDNVVEMLRGMKLQLDQVLSVQRTQLSILNYLKGDGYKFPHTFILIPKRPIESVQPRGISSFIGSIFQSAAKSLAGQLFDTMYLFFYCPITGKLVPCGKDGQGYVLSTLKRWVKQLIPIVKMGLFVAKIVLATQGLGSLVPNFPNKDDQEMLSDMVAKVTDGVGKGVEVLQSQETAADSLEDCIVSSLKDQLMDAIVAAVTKKDGMQKLTDTRAYCPKKSGLEQAEYRHPDGSVTRAWVSAEGRARFELEGPAAFR